MKIHTRILIAAIPILFLSQAFAQAAGTPLRPDDKVTDFSSRQRPALQVLVELTRTNPLVMGIVQDDDRLTSTPITITARQATLRDTLDDLLRQVPGYTWSYSEKTSVVLISPKSPRPITTAFLNLVLDRFSPPRMGVAGLQIWLWMYIRATFKPTEGTVGSILQSPGAPTVQLDERNCTVEQILDKIVLLTGGAWVLSPLPADLMTLGADPPFTVYSKP